jgi:predicted kinase
MQKNRLSQPILVYLYGLPGSGKTFVSRQLSELLGMAHLNSEQIRLELFEKPRYDASEQRIVKQLMNFMAEQFLNAGVSVIYDMSVNRLSERRTLRDFAQKHGAKDLLVWLQIDIDTAWARCEARDRRTADDKYSEDFDKRTFESFIQNMQNPSDEKALVLSGKHLFNSQKNALLRRLYDLSVLKEESLEQKIAKPELVNLVSRAQADAGRSDYLRRNVIIR